MKFIDSVISAQPLQESNGILRYITDDNYSFDFGEEWRKFGRIQFDVFTGSNLSRERFFRTTLYSEINNLKSLNVLDAGCGAGRHSQIALDLKPSNLVCVDLSHAIDFCKDNLSEAGYSLDNVAFVQADIGKLPFKSDSFDVVYCMGVIQHTPNPLATLLELCRVLKPNGQLVVDTYQKNIKSFTHLQGLWRLFFKSIGKKRAKSFISQFSPSLYPVHRKLMNYPIIRSLTWKLFPFDSSFPCLNLSPSEEYKWFIMSIEDGYLSEYIYPQTLNSLRKMAKIANLCDIHVIEQSFGDAAPLVLRGVKPIV